MMSGSGLAARPAVPAPKPAPIQSPSPSPAARPAGSGVGNAAAARVASGPKPNIDFGRDDINDQAIAFVEGSKNETAEVVGHIGSVASGTVRLRALKGKVDTVEPARLALHGEKLGPLTSLNPIVQFRVDDGKVKKLEITTEKAGALTSAINKHTEALGLPGINLSEFAGLETSIVDGKLLAVLPSIEFAIGALVAGTICVEIHDANLKLSGSGKVTLPKGQQGDATLNIERTTKGVTGAVDVGIAVGKVNGKVRAVLKETGAFEVQGTIGVQLEKFGGEVTVMVADAEAARAAIDGQMSAAGVQSIAEDAKRPVPKGKSDKRTIVGWGTLNFAVSEWLTGKAHVIVDDDGDLTIVGEIAPPAQVEFLQQRDYVKNLFKVEARAAYGLPYVGNLFVFANVGLDAMAKLGPGVLKDIKIQGTYSTKDTVAKSFSVEATLNISAFAGLRLRAEGGAGLEILGHDIKAGVGVNGIGGVRGYVQATPKIGMREVGDPKAGKKSEFYLHGHMEIAAQPFVALGGDLFVELDSPWWSPAPDKKWTWPLGQLEYPLPGQFGIGADIDYVIGSGKFPEIKTGEVNFDAKNFMTDLVDDKVPAKGKGAEEKQGTWKEGEPKPLDPKAGPAAKPGPPGPKTAGTGKGPAGPESADPKANVPKSAATAAAFANGMKELGHFAVESQQDPKDRADVDAEAALLRKKYGFTKVDVIDGGDHWDFDAKLNPAKPPKAKPKAPSIKKAKSSLAAATAIATGSVPSSPASPPKRLPRDIAANPNPPAALPTSGRSIGRPSHNAQLAADVKAAQSSGATEIRVNQQQVDASGKRVGVNRPDLQYKLPSGQRVYIEYEGPANPRGQAHKDRITANDSSAIVIVKLIP